MSSLLPLSTIETLTGIGRSCLTRACRSGRLEAGKLRRTGRTDFQWLTTREAAEAYRVKWQADVLRTAPKHGGGRIPYAPPTKATLDHFEEVLNLDPGAWLRLLRFLHRKNGRERVSLLDGYRTVVEI